MTVFRLYNGSIMKEELENYHKKDHARRYGTNAEYQKSSFNLGWRIQPITSTKGRKNYKWGCNISIHPDNLANPFTRRVPSLIDFLQTKQPRYLFYTLEDWEIDKGKELTIESDLIIKAVLYWRLMIFTNNLNEKEKKMAKHFLKTVSNISYNKLKKQNYWLYKDGLMHVYNNDTFSLKENIFNKILYYELYLNIKEKLKIYFRESDTITDINLKYQYWVKVYKTLEKNKINRFKKLLSFINFDNKDDILILFLYMNHISLKPDKSEPLHNEINYKDFQCFTRKYLDNTSFDDNLIDNISVTLSS